MCHFNLVVEELLHLDCKSIDLYDWWLRKIKEGASVGHRYSCLCVLASYAVKCDIPEDELFTDAFSLLQFLDDMSDDEHNRFTKRDIMDAMQFYHILLF